MKKELCCKMYLAIIICMGLIFCNTLAYTQQTENNDMEAAQIESHGTVHSKSEVASGPFEVSLSIDTEPCKTWPTQCSNTGHSAYGAAQSNHNPIRINVQVLSKTGAPVTNLNSGSFNISAPLTPPSAASLKKLDCNDCFLSGGDGIYSFFVHPDPYGNTFWRLGTYAMQVQVKSGSKTVRVFAPFVIP